MIQLTIRLAFIGLLLWTLLMGWSVSAQPFISSRSIGKIKLIQPLVVVRRKGEGISVKDSDLILYTGDDVLTSDSGKAHIMLSGGNEIFVAPSSTLYLTKHLLDRYKYEYELSLNGKMRAKVQKARRRKVRIKTANAMISVKGTDFVVEFKDQITSVGSLEGQVVLTSLKTNKQMDIPVGKMISVSPKGTLSKPKKIEKKLIAGLEHAGRTGIKELDPEEVPKEDPKPEAKPLPIKDKYNPEGLRSQSVFGLGGGTEIGVYSGSYIFIDVPLGSRSQIHIQHSVGTLSKQNNSSLFEGPLFRTMNAVSYRYFKDKSGIFLGLGAGKSEFSQEYATSSISANGTFLLTEFGAQTYKEFISQLLMLHIGSQLLFYSSFEHNGDQLGLSQDHLTDFAEKAKSNIVFMQISLSIYF